ncbi:MAG: hypothetical protein AAF694_00565 [Bacteroidota bacterium]
MFHNVDELRQLNKNAVILAGEYLMFEHGNTTVLEVKLWLRSQGYYAHQEEVDQWMDLISKERDWGYTCNGIFRSYFFSYRSPHEGSLYAVPWLDLN